MDRRCQCRWTCATRSRRRPNLRQPPPDRSASARRAGATGFGAAPEPHPRSSRRAPGAIWPESATPTPTSWGARAAYSPQSSARPGTATSATASSWLLYPLDRRSEQSSPVANLPTAPRFHGTRVVFVDELSLLGAMLTFPEVSCPQRAPRQMPSPKRKQSECV